DWSHDSNKARFVAVMDAVDKELQAAGGPFFLGAELSLVDVTFVPMLERIAASIVGDQGQGQGQGGRWPAVERWFNALELRPTLLGTKSDYYTHCHDLPPQLGARTQKYKQLCHSLGLKGQLIGRAAPTRWLSLRKPAERLVRDIRSLVSYFDTASSSLLTDLPTLLAACELLPILRSLNRLNLVCQSRAIFVEDLIQEVALTANKITAMYSGPSPFSALDFPELTAFTNVAGPGSCLVHNGSGHLALQPHGSGSMTVQSDEAGSDSEDEEEVGSRQAAADMETTFGENEEEEDGSELGSEPVQLYAIPPKGRRAALVPASDFQQHVDSAKQELAATADAVVRDLHSRFLPPEHAKGLAVVYAHYCDKQPSDEDFLERLAIVKARYCMDTTLANGQLAPPFLLSQQSASVEVMRCQAEHRVEQQPTQPWRPPSCSVEEERMFSAMAYLKDDTRNRLQECHLNVPAGLPAPLHLAAAPAGCAMTAEGVPVSQLIDGTAPGAWQLPLPPLSASSLPEPYSPGENPAADTLEAASAIVKNHTALVRFALRGPGQPGPRPVSAPLADPTAIPAEEWTAAGDAALRHVAHALIVGVQAKQVSQQALQVTATQPAGAAAQLQAGPVVQAAEYLRDRVGVPRDMKFPAARQLRAHLNWLIGTLTP
ncbi:hypothetical protein QJQ45_026965, partial [Haematococcus lacustris]